MKGYVKRKIGSSHAESHWANLQETGLENMFIDDSKCVLGSQKGVENLDLSEVGVHRRIVLDFCHGSQYDFTGILLLR